MQEVQEDRHALGDVRGTTRVRAPKAEEIMEAQKGGKAMAKCKGCSTINMTKKEAEKGKGYCYLCISEGKPDVD